MIRRRIERWFDILHSAVHLFEHPYPNDTAYTAIPLQGALHLIWMAAEEWWCEQVPFCISIIVFDNEVIESFYSEGLTSFVDYGNLFTDMRVISYETDSDTNERYVCSATYSEISDIRFDKSESMFEDSVIEVYEAGEYGFLLYVSNEDGCDVKFYQTLTKTWNANRESERLISASLHGG